MIQQIFTTFGDILTEVISQTNTFLIPTDATGAADWTQLGDDPIKAFMWFSLILGPVAGMVSYLLRFVRRGKS